MAGDCCGSGSSLSGPRELPWPVLLHREAPKVLPDWCSFGGGCLETLHCNTSQLFNTISTECSCAVLVSEQADFLVNARGYLISVKMLLQKWGKEGGGGEGQDKHLYLPGSTTHSCSPLECVDTVCSCVAHCSRAGGGAVLNRHTAHVNSLLSAMWRKYREFTQGMIMMLSSASALLT